MDALYGEETLRRDDYAMTLEEIGKVEGCSPQRIAEIIDRAFRKIRAAHGPRLFQMRRMYLHLEQQRARQEETER